MKYEGLLKHGLSLRPMTPDETDTFLRCMLIEKDNDTRGKIERYFFTESEEFPIRIMRARVHGFKKQVSAPLALFLCSLCENAAHVVQWAHTLFLLAQRNPGKVVTFDEWAIPFGDGVPTQAAMLEAWDAQKGKYEGNIVTPGISTDNFLDSVEAWKVA